MARRHQDIDDDPPAVGQRPQRVEAAEVGAEQDRPLLAFDQRREVLDPVQADLEVIGAPAPEADAVEGGLGELAVVAEHVAQARSPAECIAPRLRRMEPAEIPPRGAPPARVGQEEVRDDGEDEQRGEARAEYPVNPRCEPHPGERAALASRYRHARRGSRPTMPKTRRVCAQLIRALSRSG